MATAKKAPKVRSRAAAKIPGSIEIRPTYNLTPDTPMSYANHIEIARNQHEFAMLIGRVPAKLSIEQRIEAEQTGGLTLEPELQLILPASLIPGLIKALQASYDDSAIQRPDEIQEESDDSSTKH